MNTFKQRTLRYVAMIVMTLLGLGLYTHLTTPQVTGGRLEFSLATLEGIGVSQDDPRWQGKVRMVTLWGRWCPPCRQEIPHLIALQGRYRDQGFEIIAAEFPLVDSGNELERGKALSAFVQEMGINYTVLMGKDTASVAQHFPNLNQMQGFPTTIFIGRDGRVAHITTGFYEGDVATYTQYIEALLED